MLVLDQNSLAKTLWNLEEARLKGAPREAEVEEAILWIESRIGLEGAYSSCLAAPIEPRKFRNRNLMLRLPTGEFVRCVSHPLGEEAYRALRLWNGPSPLDERMSLELWSRSRSKTRPGYFCCPACTLAFCRAILAAKPEGWEAKVRGIACAVANAEMLSGGFFRRFPFFYALLALSEAPAEFTEDVRHQTRATAEREWSSLGDDQQSFFRRKALQWVLAG